MILHHPNEKPFPGDEGFEISPGKQTSIILKLVKYIKLDPPYNKCKPTFTVKDSDSNDITYSKKLCQNECIQDEIIRRCLCIDSTSETNNKTVPTCSAEDMPCMSSVFSAYLEQNLTCGCTDSCVGERYSVALSTLEWPGTSYKEELKLVVLALDPDLSTEMVDDDYILRNFLKVDVYFDEVQYEESLETPTYTITQLASDIGGQVGLWIGLSMVSIVELLSFIIQLSVATCTGKEFFSNTNSIVDRRMAIMAEEEEAHRRHTSVVYRNIKMIKHEEKRMRQENIRESWEPHC